MKVEVRYFSRSGNTKVLAEAIAKSANVSAISVDKKNSEITEDVDVLFIGGALYAYGLDKNLKQYIKTLDSTKIKKAIVFSTSWISKHSIDLIKRALIEKGIYVEEEYFYAKNRPTERELREAEKFAMKFIN